MNENTQQKQIIARAKNLQRQRKEVLALPPEMAVDRILETEHPAALVHSFPEEDFYFLVHDIGSEDSLPLLSLASNRQWEYILDIEVWKRDRTDIKSVTRWLDLLYEADPNRLIKWFSEEKTEFLEFYLYRNIEIIIREHDQDPSDFGKDFHTVDDTCYFRFIPDPLEPELDAKDIEQRNEFLSKFLELLATYDHFKYQRFLIGSSSVIPSESEEEIYRLRNIRLAEKGFLPFDEAIGIYQPLSPQELTREGRKHIERDTDQNGFLPAPLYPVGMLKEENHFTDALKVIETEEALRQIQTEFAGLANQIIAADQNSIRSREELTNIVKKACGYLSIGLEELSEQKPKLDIHRSAALIRAYPLSKIFRLGYGLALKLKWRAERWRKRCWFVKEGLPLRFWDEEWMGVLGGLFIKKPLFYDNYKTGVLYREFVSIDDIRATENILHEIIAFDDLFSLMTIKLEPILSNLFLTYKNLVLTLWAKHYLGLPDKFAPLTFDEFITIFNDLWSGEDKPRKIRLPMKDSFLNWLCDTTGFDPAEISQRLGKTLENLFSEIESELGEVLKKDLDPKFIQLFLIKSRT